VILFKKLPVMYNIYKIIFVSIFTGLLVSCSSKHKEKSNAELQRTDLAINEILDQSQIGLNDLDYNEVERQIAQVDIDVDKESWLKEDLKKYQVVYKGKRGPGHGKNIVFVATDHEYRGEESLPALARIMAKRYGFKCTVIWALDENDHILPGGSNLRGLEALEKADLMVIFTRFSNFIDEEMQYIDNYLERGGPVIGLRTATHAFSNKENKNWAHYGYNYKGEKQAWHGGFGEVVLGETWVGHYGKNHKQASLLILEDAQKEHPVLRGVKDAWAQCGGYKAFPEETNGTVLARGKILNGMTPDSEPDSTKEQMPVAWIRNYRLESGATGKVFTTTHGASEDLLSEGFRRMLINAGLWAVGLEDEIKATNNVDFVGPFKPTTFNFKGYKAKVKPSDLAGFESLIMPGEILKKND
jgi:hypothetical protein